jgi:hypothetical protein
MSEPLIDAAEIKTPEKHDDLAKDIESMQEMPIIDQGEDLGFDTNV